MATMTVARRVVVITEKAIERVVLEEILKLGAKGYNCTYCFGKGEHGLVEDPFTGPEHGCVRIEVITSEKVADAIMEFLHRDSVQHYPITSFMDNVQVDARDTFYR
jgi:hypothetical protein